jgi:hypothetical protein
MNGLLVRVAADQSDGGGFWNGPVDAGSGRFVYVAIPEWAPMHPGLAKPYAALAPALSALGSGLPPHLATRDMHLDPDFGHLTYGDQGERAKQVRAKVGPGDLLVFYAGLRNVQPPGGLVYALIGLYVVDEIVSALAVPPSRWPENAHTRRVLTAGAGDIVVRARPGVSGRLERCVPIGDFRERAYRVWPDLLEKWGGLSIANGYLQRSARLPEFTRADRFYAWFLAQGVPLVPRNN